MFKRSLPVTILLSVFVLTAMLGCPAQRKPLGEGNPPAPTAPAPQRPLPTAPNESSQLADALAAEAVKVQGVNKATVVLTGSTALVGVDLKPGADANTVKDGVAKAVKSANNQIANVLVSTDPELNSRLVRISKGIAEGRPISAFSSEITEIIKRLSPSAR
ncbi:MAG: YhcN/YlaJ family sporulation lipoprotein [Bacillota bacterium]